VFLAGRPGQHSGVDAYVFAGCDAVAVLSATLDRMGVVS
jgi:methylmalonyl-CoA mutase